MKEKFDTLSAACSKITTNYYSTSFSAGIKFFSYELRMPIYAIYGFVRLADEIVDSFHNYEKSTLLAEFRSDCFLAIDRGISLNPILNSFQQVVNKYHIDHELIELFLKSMKMDLDNAVYNKKEYDDYILGSAQVVGLMCLQIFTDGDTEAYERLKAPAMKLGSAFQKVNFLRDVYADYNDLKRSYFPEINLACFTNEDKRLIEAGILNEFAEALEGIRELPRSCRKGVYIAFVYYKKLLRKISDTSADKIMLKRIRVSNGHKFLLMFNSLIRYNLNVI